MKQNKYDDELFFEKYSQMDRSKKGLDAAGEWSTLKELLPDFNGKSVLDLGCGYGWHCIYAMEQGASSVVGVDISEKMLHVAREKTQFSCVTYLQMPVEDINFKEQSFDIVMSSLTFHYIESFDNIANKVHRCLKTGGAFVFSVEHPIFTAYGIQDWYYDEKGNILHFPVDNYFCEGSRNACFLGTDIIKYHKTLTTYINGLLKNGFEIIELVEPQPSEQLINTVEGMKNELRRPMMLIISALKK